VKGKDTLAEILEHILARRSIRKFKPDPVPKELITQLLKAAMAAPSATNRQPWEFVVITEPKRLAALRQRLPFGRYTAPLAVVVCGNMRRALPGPGRGFWIQDCSAAAENLLLAASGLHLGAVWVGVHPIGLFARAVAKVAELPKHVKPLGVLYIGYPAEEKAPRTQYDEGKIHWQRFGEHTPSE